MPFGICSAPEGFPRRMKNTFENLKGTAIIANDLLVFGKGDDDIEKNFAQIEKELLSIVHACDRFDRFVIGREITVEMDHKPLEMILRKPRFAAPLNGCKE